MRTQGLAALAIAVAMLAGAAGASAQTVIYRNANLIDGAGGPLRPGMAIVVSGERIAAVLPDRRLSAKRLAGARVVDLAGRYVLPGLIDSHEHLRPGGVGEASMRRDLYAGVTAIRDMTNDLRALRPLVEKSRSGEIAGPDVFYAALMGGPSLFDNRAIQSLSTGLPRGTAPWAQSIDETTDLPAAVARAKATGATAIKIYANLPPERVAAIAREAHRQGLRVWAHAAVFPTRPAQVLDAGADVVSHVCDLAYQISLEPPQTIAQRFPVDAPRLVGGDNPQIAALFARMRRQGVILDATNRTYREEDRTPGARPRNCPPAVARAMTAQAYRAGVAISTGTDGFSPLQEPFPPLYDELSILAREVGMPPAQVIRSATLVGAMAAGQAKDMGTVAPGKLANLMVVRANPLDNIDALRTVVLTVKRGRAYPRTDYQPAEAGR